MKNHMFNYWSIWQKGEICWKAEELIGNLLYSNVTRHGDILKFDCILRILSDDSKK